MLLRSYVRIELQFFTCVTDESEAIFHFFSAAHICMEMQKPTKSVAYIRFHIQLHRLRFPYSWIFMAFVNVRLCLWGDQNLNARAWIYIPHFCRSNWDNNIVSKPNERFFISCIDLQCSVFYNDNPNFIWWYCQNCCMTVYLEHPLRHRLLKNWSIKLINFKFFNFK